MLLGLCSHRRFVRWTRLLVSFVTVGLALVAARDAQAQSDSLFEVTSARDIADVDVSDHSCDADPGPAQLCTLRAAIMQANVTPGPQTILLEPRVYPLTIPGASEGASLTGDLDITQDVVIVGTTAG